MNIRPLLMLSAVIALVSASCSSNNCPLENTVLCNYYFYDMDGTPITYTEPITITTLMPGTQTLYKYRKLGYTTVTLDHPDSTYIADGYSETTETARRDTILVNQSSTRAYVQIPMSHFNPADTLVFKYTNISRNDTIVVSKKSYAHVELPECGTHYFHQLIQIKSTDAAIDHIDISNPLVNYEGKENVKIYFNGLAE